MVNSPARKRKRQDDSSAAASPLSSHRNIPSTLELVNSPNRRSWIWAHCDERKDEKGELRRYCRYCPTNYTNTNTSNRITHIKEAHTEKIKPTDQMLVMDMIKGKLGINLAPNPSSTVTSVGCSYFNIYKYILIQLI